MSKKQKKTYRKSKTGKHTVNIEDPPKSRRTVEKVDQNLQKLLDAIQLNNLEQCDHLLNNQSDLIKQSSPLLQAAKLGRQEIMALLLHKGADINVQLNSESKLSALHLSIINDHEQCSMILLQEEIKFKELQDSDKNLAFHLAVKKNQVEVVEWMLERNQNKDAKNSKQQTALHLAAMKGYSHMIEKLQLSSDFLDDGSTPLHYAAENGHTECCDLLLKQNSKHLIAIDKQGNTPLILAAKNGHNNLCQSFCQALDKMQDLPTDIWNHENTLGNTVLHNAAKKGSLETLQVLHSWPVNFNIKNLEGNTPLHITAIRKDIPCFTFLINSIYATCPGVNKKEQSILHLSVLNNWKDSLRCLLEKDISFKDSINLQDSKNQTALHLATMYSRQACIDILLQNGADFRLLDNEKNTPLHLAASKGLIKTCEWILNRDGINIIDWTNKKGETPLHLATSFGSHSCCSYLLEKGANINLKNNKEYSPYQVAAAEGKLDILKLFRKHTFYIINTKVKCSGDSILDIATRNGHYECCEYLLDGIDKRFILHSLYEAFKFEKDGIFQLILPRCPRFNKKNLIDEFKQKLHNYMHEALEEKKQRPIILRAIIESKWWFSAFSSCFCSKGQCGNFFQLTKFNPELARLVLDRCSVNFEGVDVYDFRLLEKDFYLEIPDPSKSTGMIFAPPFDLETGEFQQESLLHDTGCQGSPLMEALVNGSRNFVQHPLIDEYWEYKWKKYLMCTQIGLFACHALSIAPLIWYMLLSWNWIQITEALNMNSKQQPNGTAPMPHSVLDNCSMDLSSVLGLPEYQLPLLYFFRVVLFAITFIISPYYEYKMIKKFGLKHYITIGAILRSYNLFLIFVLIVPTTFCPSEIWITMNWQWFFGLLALLMSWFHLIYSLNKFPLLSVFMPITSKFVKSFILVLMYIFLIVFIFSFIFHLLFNNNPGFANLGTAFVKCIVWIVGDLAYDDFFLNKENPILYFKFSNVIFIAFVTIISGFLLVLINQPSNNFNFFESDGTWNRDSDKVKMMLKIDHFFPSQRKKNTIIFWAKEKTQDTEFMKRLMKKYQNDEILPPQTKLEPKKPNLELEDLSKQMEILILEKKEPKKPNLELEDLRKQMEILISEIKEPKKPNLELEDLSKQMEILISEIKELKKKIPTS